MFLIAIGKGDRDSLLGHLRILSLLRLEKLVEFRPSFSEERRFLLEFPFASNDLDLLGTGHFVTRGQLGSLTVFATVIG